MIDVRSVNNAAFSYTDLLEYVDFFRLDARRKQDRERQVALGQFFTPAPVARLMASMVECTSASINILDAGAGVGSLFAACVAMLCQREKRPEKISVTAYEIDESLIEYLQTTLRLCELACERVGIEFVGAIHQKDFLLAGVEMLQNTLFSDVSDKPSFNCAILNPPYRKIQTKSEARKLLQTVGIEASNLYAGFLALSMRLLEPSGEIVAITPRSFCNGPYFRDFRKDFLHTLSLRRLHVFESRMEAFNDDAVLQENIIFHAIKEQEKPEKVCISSSIDLFDETPPVHVVPYERIVHPDDPQSFIRIVQNQGDEKVVQHMSAFHISLDDLGITVSTGKVVDFRAIEFLRTKLEEGTIPLLFPTHVRYGAITWPKPEGKKPSALLDTMQTKALQIPNEHYVLVKRFSAKEEKKRIVAAVYDPTSIPASHVGFENRLNYFHCNGRGLDPTLAKGLALYLNSTLVDTYFRQFNGHTQVNATDLRNIKYPTMQQLEALADRAQSAFPEQADLDYIVREELLAMQEDESAIPPHSF